MKNKFYVDLNRIDNVTKFVKATHKHDCTVLLKHRGIDGRSLMGLLSIDLSKPIDVEVITDDEQILETFTEQIKDMIVNEYGEHVKE